MGRKSTILPFLLLTVITVGALSGCGRRESKSAPEGHMTVTVAGSTSVQPFAELLAEEFMAEKPGIVVNVQGGGSSAGARAALSGVAEIGALSRELAPEESKLHRIIIAKDGIAIIVHPSNPVEDLSLSEIQRIFSGEITNWSTVGGPDHPIHVITREEGSGTRGSFDEMVMHGVEVTPGAVVQDSNGAVRETVAGDRYAIGYISLGLVDRRVKGVKVSGAAPTVPNVMSGEYPIARPFLFVTKAEPEGAAAEFINFVLSSRAQSILAGEGLVPIR